MMDADRVEFCRHVQELAAFGHRGSGTDHERRAADYLAKELSELDPSWETFCGGRVWAGRHFVQVTVAAVGVGCLSHFPVTTILLGLIALASFCGRGNDSRSVAEPSGGPVPVRTCRRAPPVRGVNWDAFDRCKAFHRWTAFIEVWSRRAAWAGVLLVVAVLIAAVRSFVVRVAEE